MKLLVAHGTRRPAGVALVGDIAARVSAVLDDEVRVAFVDVLGPTPAEVLAGRPAGARGPAVVVPAFLARGYHVRRDLPEQVGAHPAVVTPALGPSPQLAAVLLDRLAEAGWRRGDEVVLAAAGTSDRSAERDLRVTATWLSALVGGHVELAFAATGVPSVSDAVAAARSRGATRVAVASYLLSDGLFQERLRACGADAVAEPIGTHPGVIRLIVSRFRRARVPDTLTV